MSDLQKRSLCGPKRLRALARLGMVSGFTGGCDQNNKLVMLSKLPLEPIYCLRYTCRSPHFFSSPRLTGATEWGTGWYNELSEVG
jgi:hypothetical protein